MQLITKADLARRAGVSTAAVSKLTKKGARLGPAVHNGKVDVSDPIVQGWMLEREDRAERKASQIEEWDDVVTPPGFNDHAPTAPEVHHEPIPSYLEKYADMTLRQIVNHYGTFGQFEDMLKALKTIEDIQEKRIKNAERKGELIDRQFVKTHVLGLIKGMTSRLLGETVESISRKVPDIVKAGGDHNDVRPIVLDLMSSEIKAAVSKATRRLEDASRSA